MHNISYQYKACKCCCYLIARYSLKAPQLLAEIRKSNGVVKNSISSKIVRIWTPDYANEWKLVTVGTGDRVEYAEAADSEGDNASSNPSGSGIAVSRISSVELVTAAYEVDPRHGYELVQQYQVEVTGDREYVGDANLDEATSQVATES